MKERINEMMLEILTRSAFDAGRRRGLYDAAVLVSPKALSGVEIPPNEDAYIDLIKTGVMEKQEAARGKE